MPFRAEKLIHKGTLDKCDLATSVRQNLRLLLITPPVRVKFDPFYGCKIHWFQFLASNRAMERRKEEDDFKYKIEQNITALIERFEPRGRANSSQPEPGSKEVGLWKRDAAWSAQSAY